MILISTVIFIIPVIKIITGLQDYNTIFFTNDKIAFQHITIIIYFLIHI